MRFWALKMAWRDSRGSRRRLLLYLSSMVLGVAALVAINSFGANLEDAVDEQAKTLLGADLSLESSQPFSESTEALIDSLVGLGGVTSRRVSFNSMAYFPRSGDTRLATIRAIEGDYPYYGEVETTPPEAADTYLARAEALVDATLLAQYDVEVGDSVRIGTTAYRIAGRIDKTPRENVAMSLFSPSVYIPREGLDEDLLGLGARAEYEVYFLFPDSVDVDALRDEIQPHLRTHRVGSDTVAEIKENWDEGLTNLYRFLSLVGFVALLLGGLGIASAVHVYVRQRLESVAVLRCLGAPTWATVRVYLLQAVAMGIVGGALGCLVGVGVQALVPRVLADFLPVQVDVRLAWEALALGFGVGVGVTVLFALLPLVSVRRVSPLRAIRASFEVAERRRFDPLRLVAYALLGAGIVGFAITQAPTPRIGVFYAAGVAAVFGLLAVTAVGLMAFVRRFFPSRWPYPGRQGVANLYRPQNQTLILTLALGLGTFLIMTLFLVQQALLGQIEVSNGAGQPNIVLFDIQPDQIEDVEARVHARGLPVLDRVPIVTMRVDAINGRTVESMRADSTVDVGWALRREYRSTYRDYLTEAEHVVAGRFDETVPPGWKRAPKAADTEPVPISVEQEVAAEMGVTLGDTIMWNVQGVRLPSIVTSLREVEWRRLSTNFFVVFPTGALDDAPQFFVLLSRTPDEQAAAALQAEVVREYPNISAVDLSLVLSVFNAVFSRIAFVIRFMALFSILTGLVVLASAVVVSRVQRIEESVLLKTLGASRRQVFTIMLVEYVVLGLFAAATGLILALAGSWALTYHVFSAPFTPAVGPILGALVIVPALTVLIGLLNSRGVYDRPPLEVLRAEA